MGCGCRKGTQAGSITSSGATVTGFEYTAPDKTVKTFLLLVEAKKEQRRNGGGTIKQLTG
ncbi:hypothetical protein BKG78_23440 [Mycobacteroides chelonae]|nr:hypothetical protein BKG78_23440 [Mycobacteroides chelonae]